MAQEIGTYYVSLMPSGRGFTKAAQGQAEEAFKGAEKSSNGFFSGLAKWAKRGAVAVGGIVTAVGALAVGGGISRALNIEDATAKLKGLGHDTKAVDQIMTDALASVKGTAFGLDAAATAAASAVAAGIKPGQELERYLRLTADAATIAGVSMEEMGSIINKVTAKGTVRMDDLNMMTERGIPIIQMLAKEYGVSAEEMTKMVSKGEVDAARFRKALEDNVGGAALESGNTTRGAFANMRAALSRLGLAFVGDGLEGAKTFFNEVTKILDGLTERFGPWVDKIQEKLGGAFKIEGLSDKVLAGVDKLADIIKNFDWTPLALTFEALKPLRPALREMGERIGPVLAETFKEIWRALEPLIPLLADSLVDAIIELVPPLTDLIVALLPLIPPLVDLGVRVIPLLTEALEWLVPIIADIVEGIANFVDFAMILQETIWGETGTGEFIRRLEELDGWVGEVADTLLALTLTVRNVVTDIQVAWNTGWLAIQVFFTIISAKIQAAVKTMWNALPESFRVGILTVMVWMMTLEIRVKAALANAGSWLVNSGKELINGFIRGIRSKISEVANAVNAVLSIARGFFPNSPAKWGPFSGAGWTQLQESGSEILAQFMSGMERDLPMVQARLNTSLALPSGIAAAAYSGPSELVVRDVNDLLVGRMRVEAGDVVAGVFAPSSAVAVRSGFGPR